jgi:thymidine phosphorylase
MGANDKIDPLAGFYSMAMVRASVMQKDGLEALYARLRRELEDTYSGDAESFAQAIRKLARICRI